MMRLATILCLLAVPALAAPYGTATVLDTATNITASITSEFTGQTFKTVRVENGGIAAVYCSRDPAVTTNTGSKVAGSDGWQSFPYDGPIYCIAAASQSGVARDHVIVWASYQ
jgi:hypothetical protein